MRLPSFTEILSWISSRGGEGRGAGNVLSSGTLFFSSPSLFLRCRPYHCINTIQASSPRAMRTGKVCAKSDKRKMPEIDCTINAAAMQTICITIATAICNWMVCTASLTYQNRNPAVARRPVVMIQSPIAVVRSVPSYYG